MFLFFSNRLGCLGSLLISAILTLALILLLRACTGHRSVVRRSYQLPATSYQLPATSHQPEAGS